MSGERFGALINDDVFVLWQIPDFDFPRGDDENFSILRSRTPKSFGHKKLPLEKKAGSFERTTASGIFWSDMGQTECTRCFAPVS
jgi:hypothetical protein